MTKFSAKTGVAIACLVPLFYLLAWTPLGMDTTDFGYFYGYAWRILEGQTPYRDFSYIKPALPLYWHAFWLWLTPENLRILGGKTGFLASMLATAWLASLYLHKVFNFQKLNLPLPLLATTAFVFGVHTFPHMPWHTVDGALFCAFALWLGIGSHPALAGILAACAMCCKQSFMLVPLAIFLLLLLGRPRRLEALWFAASCLASLGLAAFFVWHMGAWADFRQMTTGQLDIREAIEAGILIYLRQNWLLPAFAVLPWLACRILKKAEAEALLPCYCYMGILATWYITQVFIQKRWIGFGASWPTLFVLLGAICVIMPKIFLPPSLMNDGSLQKKPLAASLGLLAPLVCAWSVAISGGYKIPAFFAAPLLFAFFLIHARMGGNVRILAWTSLFCGLLMFGVGYQYPYVFPERPLSRADLTLDAGEIYPQASGVKIDAQMYAKLRELKELRQKYGDRYKTLPGFTLAYFLNNDFPAYSSDWLIDWEINGQVDRLYQELLDKKLTVFMERDQLDTKKADNYARAGYGVPQRVRANWRIVEETPHFVVFQPPR